VFDRFEGENITYLRTDFAGEGAGVHKDDFVWLGTILCLVVIGIIMVYSSSAHVAIREKGNSFYFAFRQMIFAFFGLGILLFFRFLPYQKLQKGVPWLMAVTLLSLFLVLVPGIGYRVGGASRWFRIFGISVQPSEFAKLVVVNFLAWSMARRPEILTDFKKGYLFHWAVVGVFILLIIKEPDLGMGVMITLVTAVMLFIGGVRIKHLVLSALPLIPLAYFLVWRVPYRWARVLSFMDPWKDPLGSGFHLKHSFLAFGSGGWFGQGLSQSKMKLFYLPEPHTDFILSIIGEEFGFLGVLVIIALYLILIIKCFQLTLRVTDPFGRYLVVGISVLIGLQALVNMLVVMGLVPTKGLTLPFLSYGGSSLILNMICIGILMNIASQHARGTRCAS